MLTDSINQTPDRDKGEEEEELVQICQPLVYIVNMVVTNISILREMTIIFHIFRSCQPKTVSSSLIFYKMYFM